MVNGTETFQCRCHSVNGVYGSQIHSVGDLRTDGAGNSGATRLVTGGNEDPLARHGPGRHAPLFLLGWSDRVPNRGECQARATHCSLILQGASAIPARTVKVMLTLHQEPARESLHADRYRAGFVTQVDIHFPQDIIFLAQAILAALAWTDPSPHGWGTGA